MTAVIFSDLNVALDRDGVTLSQVEIDAYIDGVMAAPIHQIMIGYRFLARGYPNKPALTHCLFSGGTVHDPGFPQGMRPNRVWWLYEM